MATTIVPLEHSPVGGSTAARRIGCPRSLVLEAKVPADTGSIYAREGTALHEMMARILIDEVEPESLLPFTYTHAATEKEPEWSFTVDDRLWYEIGEPALAAYDRFCTRLEETTGGEIVTKIEERCAFPGIEGSFGTTDVLGRCGDIAFIWDWKFGSGPVAAYDNAQLLFYATAARSDHPGFFHGVNSVWLCIMQPKIDDQGPDIWPVEQNELKRFTEKLQAAVEETKRDGENARIEKGDWCKFAPCRAICPNFAGVGIALAEKLAEHGHLDNKGKPRVSAIDIADDLPALLEMAEAASEWIKAMHSAAHNYVEGGGTIEGYKLVAKRSSGRDWTRDEAKIKQWFSRNGVPVDEYAPRQLITPPAAEKVLKLHDKDLPEKLYTAKPSSGTSLVREDNSREAVGTAKDVALQLASQLEKYRGEA